MLAHYMLFLVLAAVAAVPKMMARLAKLEENVNKLVLAVDEESVSGSHIIYAENCPTTYTMTTTRASLCVPASGGIVEYTAKSCGDNKIEYVSARALDRRDGLSEAACTWKASAFDDAGRELYFGGCGVAPEVNGGDQLPTQCLPVPPPKPGKPGALCDENADPVPYKPKCGQRSMWPEASGMKITVDPQQLVCVKPRPLDDFMKEMCKSGMAFPECAGADGDMRPKWSQQSKQIEGKWTYGEQGIEGVVFKAPSSTGRDGYLKSLEDCEAKLQEIIKSPELFNDLYKLNPW